MFQLFHLYSTEDGNLHAVYSLQPLSYHVNSCHTVSICITPIVSSTCIQNAIVCVCIWTHAHVDKHENTILYHAALASGGGWMWDHPDNCGCPICRCLARIGSLLQLGAGHSTFNGFVLSNLRFLEAELRDELTRLGPPPAGVHLGGAAPPAPPPPAREAVDTSQPSTSAPSSCGATSKTAPPPSAAPPESSTPLTCVKEEPKEEKKESSTPGVEDLTGA